MIQPDEPFQTEPTVMCFGSEQASSPRAAGQVLVPETRTAASAVQLFLRHSTNLHHGLRTLGRAEGVAALEPRFVTCGTRNNGHVSVSASSRSTTDRVGAWTSCACPLRPHPEHTASCRRGLVFRVIGEIHAELVIGRSLVLGIRVGSALRPCDNRVSHARWPSGETLLSTAHSRD